MVKKRPTLKQPLKTALVPVLGLVFKKALEFLTFFIILWVFLGYFWLCYTKAFIVKVLFKTHFLTSLCGVSGLKVNNFSL
ncbi:hypothetical protein HpRN110_07540 [Helicobacter pylori]